MKNPSTPLLAKLLSRPNRFLGIVNLEGVKTQCFIPNPGRMRELMQPGTNVYLIHRPEEHRKTKYDLTLVEYNDILVSIDSRLPNHMLKEAIDEARITEFKGYRVERTEIIFYDSRLDLQLSDGASQILVEAKSCTLVEDGVALFPDAPTVRGARHMNTLIKALENGRAAACFIIQREDAKEWRPNYLMDPDFTENIRKATEKGVEAYAYNCKISLEETIIQKRVPISLE